MDPNLRLLVVCEPFGRALGAQAAARWLAQGLREGGLTEPDVLTLPAGVRAGADLQALLERERLGQRMAASRALLIAAAHLDGRVLQDTPAFELATRARQGGIPSYAITAANGLDSFQARILDLQLILEAGGPHALRDAARVLAAEVMAGLGS